MKKLNLVAAALLLCAGVTPSTVQARDLTVTAWGGSSQAAQTKLYYGPFTAKTGTKIVEDSLVGGHRHPAHQGQGRDRQLGPRPGRG